MSQPPRQKQQTRDGRQRDEHLLRALRSDPGDQEQARAECADDGAESVGGIDPGEQLGGILPSRCGGRERQGEARAPQDRRRQEGPKCAGEVELES